MKIVLLFLVIPLAGCGVADLAQKQADWNRQMGMGGMNSVPTMSSPGNGQAESDADVQRRIKQGEDLENREARQAGFGPSPTEGMNCTTTSSYSGTANSGTSTSHTSCHN